MADLNELFAQATVEADGFSAEGARAQEAVQRLARLATALGESIEAGGAEARRRMEILSARLQEAEQDTLRETNAATVALGALREASAEVAEGVGRYLTAIHAELADLRAERERVSEDLQQQGEMVQDHVSAYAAHVREVDTSSRTRLELARQAIAAFRLVVETSRTAAYQRREALVAEMRQLELSGRQRMDYLVHTYDALAAAIQAQVGEVQAALQSLTDQSAEGLTRRLGREALEALASSAEPLRDAISSLEEFCEESRKAHGDRLDEITRRVEDVTEVLERLRHPLETVKQHLG